MISLTHFKGHEQAGFGGAMKNLGMGGGSRSLDLQPGVWKAFGYSSCDDWGLRTVSYRIL